MKSESSTRYGIVLWTGERLGVGEAVDLGVAAEEAGWDGVFVPDELSAGYADPWTVLSAIAAATKRVRLGTWITPVAHQQPWRVAHSAAAADQLSNGRLILGAGLGAPNEHRTFGGSYDARQLGRRYDEALDVISGLWSGESFSHSGEFFTVQNAKLAVTPVQQPRIPIVMGCWWPNKKPFRRAAHWDGIMPFWPSLLRDGTGPQGEAATGPIGDELRALMPLSQRALSEDSRRQCRRNRGRRRGSRGTRTGR
jgi:alkanesulfonate monooxygenase SsuD/methylene tetrahydromethanopterin reductase-like flavin-dependent oxidoreductase (luciferase family)